MQVDKPLFYLSVALMSISIIFVFSMSLYIGTHYNSSVDSGFGEYNFLIKQMVAIFIGIALMWSISLLDPDYFFKPLGFGLFFLFMLLTIIMNFFSSEIVSEINGAKRWIRLPFGFSIAPVEFFKVGFIFFLAWSFSRKIDISHKSFSEDISRFLPYVVFFALIVYLVAFLQHDFGQIFLLGFVLLIMASMAGVSSRVFLLGIFSATVVFSYIILSDPRRIERIQGWLYDFQNLFASIFPHTLTKSSSYVSTTTQVSASHDAIINGGFWGTGIGNGIIKLGFLPEIHTDFILSGIAEETGVFGLSGIIVIYFIIIFRILRVANRSQTRMYSLFAFGIALMISFSLFINAFGITGLIPIKGIAVPLLSYGGSSILATSIALGMVLMISKRMRE
jgi:cell division protein FtsW